MMRYMFAWISLWIWPTVWAMRIVEWERSDPPKSLHEEILGPDIQQHHRRPTSVSGVIDTMTAASDERRAIALAIGMQLEDGEPLPRWKLVQYIMTMKVRLDRIREISDGTDHHR